MDTKTNARIFTSASTRLENDGVHWTGTFRNIVKAALTDLLTDGPVDVVVRRDFGTEGRVAFVPVTATAMDGALIRGIHQHTGDDVAIDVVFVTGLAF